MRRAEIERNSTISALLDQYMAEAQMQRSVEGYLELQALLTFRVLAAAQLEQGVAGGVAEIGVHHGMSFAPLCLLNADAPVPGVAVAVDIFERQHLNYDGSGAGNLEIFQATVAKWCGAHNMRADRFMIIKADSLQLTADDVLRESAGARIRFFSVDGSHVEEAAYQDMKTAAGCLVEVRERSGCVPVTRAGRRPVTAPARAPLPQVFHTRNLPA